MVVVVVPSLYLVAAIGLEDGQELPVAVAVHVVLVIEHGL